MSKHCDVSFCSVAPVSAAAHPICSDNRVLIISLIILDSHPA